MRTTISLLVFAVVLSVAHAAGENVDPVQQIKTGYEKKSSSINKKYDTYLKPIIVNYNEQVYALEKQLQKMGDPEGAAVVHKERQRFLSSMKIGDSVIVKSPAELKTLQTEYNEKFKEIDEKKQEELSFLFSQCILLLESLEKKYTKTGKVDEARLVEKEIDKFKKEMASKVDKKPPLKSLK